jgi:hypothetical protein
MILLIDLLILLVELIELLIPPDVLIILFI